MNRFNAAALACLLAWNAASHAAVTYYDIAGSSAEAENGCPAWVPEFSLDDCSFNASNPSALATLQWIGPVFSAGYYAPGNAPLSFQSPTPDEPVTAPAPALPVGGKTGIPIARGFIAIDDKGTPAGTDDVITGTIEFGAFERNVAVGPVERVVESFERIIHRISGPTSGASNVGSATANASGGLDYVVGLAGTTPVFPPPLAGSTTAGGGVSDVFPSEVASQSSAAAGDVPFWSAAGANGIARNEGTSAVLGARVTSASVWGYDCFTADGPCTTFSESNWNADSRARFENVIIRFSTTSAGTITAAEAYLVNESDLSAALSGADSWAATTLAFSGTADPRPDAYDDRSVLVSGLDLNIFSNVLANDVPGVAPVTVTIEQQGTAGTAEVLTTPANVANFIVYTPAVSNPADAVDVVTYRVTDANGDTATGELAVTITDPVTCTDDTTSGPQNAPVTFDVLANDGGFDVPPVTVTIISTPGQGSTTVVNPDLTITFTPPADTGGIFGVVYQVRDGTGEPAQCTLGVRIEETPVATDDTAIVKIDTALVLNVLANDSGTADTPLTLAVTTPPAHGTAEVATISGAPRIRYTPATGYVGADSFSYRFTDASGDQSTIASVSLTVIGPPASNAPACTNDTATGERNQSTVIDVLANDTGLDVPPITLAVTSVLPALGTAVVNPDNTLTFTPNADRGGVFTITYRVSEAINSAVSCTATVRVDDVPVAVADTRTVPFNRATDIPVLANDTGLSDTPVTVAIVAAPAHGTAQVVTVSGSQRVRYTPDSGYTGSDSFSYRITDTDGDSSADATVTLTVQDTNPAGVADTATVNHDQAVTVDVLANDTGLTDTPVTLAIVEAPTHGAAEVVPGSSRPSIRYTPEPGYDGPDQLRYTVTDADGDVSSATLLSITVVDEVPAALPDTLEAGFGGFRPADVLNNDEGLGDGPVTIEITQQPSHGTVEINTTFAEYPLLVYRYDDAAAYPAVDSLRYRVIDADGDASAPATLTIAPNNELVARSDPDGAVTERSALRTVPGRPVVIDVLRNDAGLLLTPITITIIEGSEGNGRAEVIDVDGRPQVRFTPSEAALGELNSGFAYFLTDSSGQESSGAAVILDVYPPPESDLGGSATGPVTLSLLLAGRWLRRRRRAA